MTRWRQRMGEEKLTALLQESLSLATRRGAACDGRTPRRRTADNRGSPATARNSTSSDRSQVCFKTARAAISRVAAAAGRPARSV